MFARKSDPADTGAARTPTSLAQPVPDRRPHVSDVVRAGQLSRAALRPADLIFHSLLAAGAVVALGGLYPLWVRIAWLGALSLVLFARWRTQVGFQRAGEGADPDAWTLRFAAGAFATGLVWSLTSSVFLLTGNLDLDVIALALVGCIGAAGVARNAASSVMMIAFEGPLLAVTIAILVMRPDPFHLTLALALGGFGVVLLSTGRSLHQEVATDLGMALELLKSGATVAGGPGTKRTGIWEYDLATGRMAWSAELHALMGLSSAPAGSTIQSLMAGVHPEDRGVVEATIAEWLAGRAALDIEHRTASPDGEVAWVAQAGLMRGRETARGARCLAVVQDITERKRAEAQIQFANIVMRTQIEAVEDAILVLDRNGRIISSNLRLVTLFSVPRESLGGDDLPWLQSHLRATGAGAIIDLLARTGALGSASEHNEVDLADGRVLTAYSSALVAPDEALLGRAWFFRDVTDQKRALADVLETARHDPLTGLLNRTAFADEIATALQRLQAGGPRFSVLSLDLDQFKDVNEALGHGAGDDLLRAVSQRLRSLISPSNAVARLGGDEFAILAREASDLARAHRLASEIIGALARPHELEGVMVRGGASVGIALAERDAASPGNLVSRADLALYKAKSQGAGTVCAFTEAMETEVRDRVALGAALQEAIDQGQLFLLYQPLVRLGVNGVAGVEALVRWRHPSRGVLGPDQFIPLAEQTGLIGRLGKWVLDTACREALPWRDAAGEGVRLAVNVSPLQFRSASAFEEDLDLALAASGLPAARLELEMTETVLFNSYRENAELFHRMRARGVGLAIDDFGTGYSSLAYLRQLPASRIKIAKEFIQSMEDAREDAAIVRTIVSLARELDMEIIAEGVELDSQLALLEGLGCDEAQGYLFSRPLPAEDISRILAQVSSIPPGAALTPGLYAS
jgi:diguanylate cyclase (GGDEF)-like protein/PAS domain S-box-containing protein